MTKGNIMKNYETMVIIDAMITEDAVEREVRKIEAKILDNGEMINVDRWGKRKLAYEIRKKTHGVYVVFYYNSAINMSELLERDFRINENIVRWMTLADQPLPAERPEIDDEVLDAEEDED
jgi:small subunit ribosomal protein S6